MSEKIIVRGEGEARATPDRALVNVKADGEGVERDAAYSAAAEVARQVDEVLNNFQAVRTWLLLLAFVLVCLAVSLAS